MTNFDTLLFDLDGTLTDSLPGITRSIQYALGKMGIEEADAARLRRFVGPPLHITFAEQYGMSPAAAQQAIDYYREYFGEIGIFENAVYPGIPALLAEVTSQHHIALATSKPTVYAERILAHFELTGYFTAIIGSHLDGRRTDKAEVIRDALLAVPGYGRVVMVGDRAHDVFGARANGIPVIAVAYGYATPEELRDAAPDAIADDVPHLARLLAAGLNRGSAISEEA